jgi:hypothetical protein
MTLKAQKDFNAHLSVCRDGLECPYRRTEKATERDIEDVPDELLDEFITDKSKERASWQSAVIESNDRLTEKKMSKRTYNKNVSQIATKDGRTLVFAREYVNGVAGSIKAYDKYTDAINPDSQLTVHEGTARKLRAKFLAANPLKTQAAVAGVEAVVAANPNSTESGEAQVNPITTAQTGLSAGGVEPTQSLVEMDERLGVNELVEENEVPDFDIFPASSQEESLPVIALDEPI